MKKWIVNNRLYFIGGITGAIAGFLYWKGIGCITGTCAITSKPINSSLYFSVLGMLLFSSFKKGNKQKQGDK